MYLRFQGISASWVVSKLFPSAGGDRGGFRRSKTTTQSASEFFAQVEGLVHLSGEGLADFGLTGLVVHGQSSGNGLAYVPAIALEREHNTKHVHLGDLGGCASSNLGHTETSQFSTEGLNVLE